MTTPAKPDTETPTKPSITEFVESMTGYENMTVEDHFSVTAVTDLGGARLMAGLVYILLKRTDDTVTWDDVLRKTTKSLGDYFKDDKQDEASGNV